MAGIKEPDYLPGWVPKELGTNQNLIWSIIVLGLKLLLVCEDI